MTVDAWESAVREGRVPADAQVRFAPVTGASFRRAGDLEMYAGLLDVQRIAWQQRFVSPPPPWMTALLVGAQVRLWWLAQLPETSATLHEALVRWTPLQLERGEVWRILTMGFFHTGFGHAAANLIWLGYTGAFLERALGPARLLLVYVAAVAGGGLAGTFLRPQNPSLGASGGVFGLIAAAVIFGMLRPEVIPDRARRFFGFALLPYLVVMFFSGLSSAETDNACHAGGLLVGAALGALLSPPGDRAADQRDARTAGATIALITAALAVMATLGPRLSPLASSEVVLAAPALGRGGLPATPPRPDAIAWSAPHGWRTDRSLGGHAVLRSPTGDAAWGVVETDAEGAIDARTLCVRERDRLGGEPAGEVSGDADLASAVWTVEVGDRTWQTAVQVRARGRRALIEIWEVDAAWAAHLAPLADRLRSRTAWPRTERVETLLTTPPPTTARESIEAIEALADEGELAVAVARLDEALARWPASARLWELQARLVRWHAGRPDLMAGTLGDPLARLDATLAAGASSGGVGEVIAALDALAAADPSAAALRRQEAVGLAELAWRARPGDGAIAAARSTIGLNNALSPDGVPRTARWAWVDAAGEVAPRTVPAPPPPTTVDRAAAAVAGAELLRGREALARRAADAPPARLAADLLLLAHGHSPAEPAVALGALRTALNEAARDTEAPPSLGEAPRGEPRWWSSQLPPLVRVAEAVASVDDAAVLALLPPPTP